MYQRNTIDTFRFLLAGRSVCATGMMCELCHCSYHQGGDTALHWAARHDNASCVRALLSHPGIEINIKNKREQTAMMVAGHTCLGVFNQMLKTCNEFPVDSYGKVVLCGKSKAGKSSLTQVGCLMKSGTAVVLYMYMYILVLYSTL